MLMASSVCCYQSCLRHRNVEFGLDGSMRSVTILALAAQADGDRAPELTKSKAQAVLAEISTR